MANKVLAIFEKPIYLSCEPVDPHLFLVGLGIADTPVEINVLMREAGITYAVKNQQVKGPKLAGMDLQEFDTSPGKLVEFWLQHGAKVWVVEEDMKTQGIVKDDLIAGVEVVKEHECARLVDEHEATMVF